MMPESGSGFRPPLAGWCLNPAKILLKPPLDDVRIWPESPLDDARILLKSLLDDGLIGPESLFQNVAHYAVILPGSMR